MEDDIYIVMELLFEKYAKAKNSQGVECVINNEFTKYDVGDTFSKRQCIRQAIAILEAQGKRDDDWRKLQARYGLKLT